MERMVFVIDVTKCVACYNCFIACKDEFVDHSWLPYSEAQPDMGPAWISVKEIERGQFPKVKVCYVPELCMQCENPPCIKIAKDGAVWQREDGVVIIDPQKSKGQRQIVKACPYGSIYWNEELEIPQKCTFCAHLLDQGWKEPRCVEVCPTQALRFGKRAEFVNVIAEAEQLHPEYRRRPSVYYIGLPKTFIAGTAYCNASNDCIEGARVLLIKKPEGEVFTTVTDNYGDFEFEGFKAGSTYSLKIEVEGYHPVIIEDIFNEKNVYLGDIYLRKRVE